MTIDWGAIVQKIPELAMVIAVIYFSLEMTKNQREAARVTMQEWREFLKSEAESNRKFLSDLRDQQNMVVGRLAEEQKVVGQQLAVLTATINTLQTRRKVSD